MTPDEKIRALLDERGIDYQMHDGGNRVCFYFEYSEQCGDFLKSIDVIGACVIASQSYLTPEQAIAATVGTEPDEATMLKLHDRMNAALLDYESARGIEGGNGANTVPFVIEMHQIIEDAATAGVGTCRNVSDPPSGFLCSECGWGDFDEPTHLLKDAKHCPNCGRRIIEEETE